jgi:cellulose synthase/poly-beta-1,6-N-acetylglucosamine synthase-like glycosyltransferase
MRVAICIPSRGDMMIGTAFDLATMCGYDSRFRTDGDQSIYTVAGTLIFDQRNKLAEAALNENADYVLWIDADMRFPKTTIQRLLAHDKDIVGVNATTRHYPVKPTAKNLQADFEKKESTWVPVDSLDKTGIERVTAIGCGVMLVKRKVFEETPKPWFWFYDLAGNKILGEDIHFCVAAHDAGFETWVDHDLSKEIGHIGQYTYSWDDIRNGFNDLQRPPDNGRKLSRKKRSK